MKGLIWFGCLLVLSIITTALKTSGIMLGAIPTVLLYGGGVWVAKKLCNMVDDNKKNDDTAAQ